MGTHDPRDVSTNTCMRKEVVAKPVPAARVPTFQLPQLLIILTRSTHLTTDPGQSLQDNNNNNTLRPRLSPWL